MESTQSEIAPPPSLFRQIFGVRTLVGLAVAGVVVYVFLTEFDLKEAWSALEHARWQYLLAAFAVYYLSVPLRGGRWHVLLKSAGYTISTRKLSLYYILSWFLNAILPSRLGDLYRGYLPKRHHGVPFSASIGVLFSEKVIDLAVTAGLVLVSGSFYWRRFSGGEEAGYLYWVLGAVAIMVAVFLALVLLLPRVVKRLQGKWRTRLEIGFPMFSRGHSSFGVPRLSDFISCAGRWKYR